METTMEPWSWAALALCGLSVLFFQWLIAGRPRGVAAAGAPRGGDRSKLNARRKLQHTLSGVLIYAATAFFPTSVASAVLLAASLAFLCIHALRKRSDRVDRWFVEAYYGILRREELARRVLPGSFYFLLGTALALAVFSRPIARLSLLHVSVRLLHRSLESRGCADLLRVLRPSWRLETLRLRRPGSSSAGTSCPDWSAAVSVTRRSKARWAAGWSPSPRPYWPSRSSGGATTRWCSAPACPASSWPLSPVLAPLSARPSTSGATTTCRCRWSRGYCCKWSPWRRCSRYSLPLVLVGHTCMDRYSSAK